MRGYGEGGRR